MPEGVSVSTCPSGQDACWEQLDDIEEEVAVIRSGRTQQKSQQVSSEGVFPIFNPGSFKSGKHHSVHICFEKQWLMTCMLRL